MEELMLGIDDAGRGPVIGPMILAGVIIDSEQRKYLRGVGVNDSKKLTQKRRELLEKEIISNSKGYFVIRTTPEEIELNNKEGTKLNEVEAIKAAKIIDELNKFKDRIKVFVDCPSTSLINWAEYLKTKINNLSNLEISCEHKADSNHICVAAASILAKCEREREMGKLREEFGEEIGSGYTSDPLTRKFLEKYALKYKDKGIFRKTWVTWQKASEALAQQTLNV